MNEHDDYQGTEPVTWADLQVGDRIRIDNYEHGAYPLASPRLSGVYTVKDVRRKLVQLEGRRGFPRVLRGRMKLVRILPDTKQES